MTLTGKNVPISNFHAALILAPFITITKAHMQSHDTRLTLNEQYDLQSR